MRDFLKELGIEEVNSGAYADGWIAEPTGEEMVSSSPIDGKPIARIRAAGKGDYDKIVTAAEAAFTTWRETPAPVRGDFVRQIGDELRRNKHLLGQLVTLEMGKILPEGEGEVQEMIDICDFAVGLSRQLYGKAMHSERPGHRMYEQWHPLGPIGVITAFNFPVAVWSWNTAIALVCGDPVIWKPSHSTPLCAVAIQKMVDRVMQKNGLPRGLVTIAVGDRHAVGKPMVADERIKLISATGSTAMGKAIGREVAERFGRSILELGGNNAVTVTEGANLDLATRAVLFGAVGTAGQRCTSTRRLLLHKPVAEEMTKRLIAAYKQVRIGNPLDASTLMGPMVNRGAVDDMMAALKTIKQQGGEVIYGGEELKDMPSDCYVMPTIVRAKSSMPIVQEETFAPILYVIEADTVDELIAIQNGVPQGLSSSMFTDSLNYSETFLSVRGSDCGIAGVNIGTSGAEIGGAFGGEKETGGGREAGSDSWKAYMRRQTVTVNWSGQLPLAQGIKFE